jgi:hypothetical protein
MKQKLRNYFDVTRAQRARARRKKRAGNFGFTIFEDSVRWIQQVHSPKEIPLWQTRHLPKVVVEMFHDPCADFIRAVRTPEREHFSHAFTSFSNVTVVTAQKSE